MQNPGEQRVAVEGSHAGRGGAFAIAMLLAGATAIATSALFVKVSETGPISTAFWRVFLALPFLWAWALFEGPQKHLKNFRRDGRLMLAAGVFFAGDLAVWHWSIILTSVANATLLANLAPIFVTLAAWLLFRKAPSALFLFGMATGLFGVVLLLGGDLASGGMALLGDALGVITAMFYAAYQLSITRLRSAATTSSIMAWSGIVMAVILLPIAMISGEQFFPVSTAGWMKLFGLALISQVAGQSMIAYAMAHLPATFSSVGLLLQPVMAALFAWLLLGEAVSAVQMLGGTLVLIGIRITHQAGRKF